MSLFPQRYRRLGVLLTALFLLCFFVTGPLHLSSVHLGSVRFESGAAIAQPTPIRRVNPSAISEQIYQQLPDIPLENQYISSDTGDVATENTLISRFIRYHLYLQNRPTVFRLDWKLTMADYLGAFERISPDRYADYGLQSNPYQNDIAAIGSLSAEQRNALVNALYEAFTTPDDASERSADPS